MLLTYSPHIVVVTETWLSSEISSTCIAPPGYKMIRKDRGSRGGGVAIILENNVDCVILDCDLSETLCCKVGYRDMTFIVIATYRVPNAQVEFLDGLNAVLCRHV